MRRRFRDAMSGLTSGDDAQRDDDDVVALASQPRLEQPKLGGLAGPLRPLEGDEQPARRVARRDRLREIGRADCHGGHVRPI